jgi:hypothetical protein
MLRRPVQPTCNSIVVAAIDQTDPGDYRCAVDAIGIGQHERALARAT